MEANWNKTLSSETRALYGISDSSIPDDVFQMLFYASFEGKSVCRLTITDPDNKPIPNTPVIITKPSGNLSVSMNSRGQYIFKAAANEQITVGLDPRVIDLAGSISINTTQTGITEIVLKVSYVDFKLLTGSATINISPRCKKLDISLSAGGGGGGGCYGNAAWLRSGAGGGGGYSIVKEDVVFEPFQDYLVIIGAGGTGGNPKNTNYRGDGRNGGTSSAFGITVTGGTGGKGSVGTTGDANNNATNTAGGYGDGKGGDAKFSSVVGDNFGGTQYKGSPGSPGTEGSGIVYKSMTETISVGGGGGGGATNNYNYRPSSYSYDGGTGGGPYGGSGGNISWEKGSSVVTSTGRSARGYSGGGGGSSSTDGMEENLVGGSGRSGVAGIRMWH